MRVPLLLLLAFSFPANASTIYQCRDASGRLTLQDGPCAGGPAEKTVRSGQDVAKERYLAGGANSSESFARGVTYAMSCRTAQDWYNSARRAADAAATRGDLRQMQDANGNVDRAGRRIAELGC
ncbi:DUF4124 domain-containing protein [Cupriavidus metallidurans]|uniref:DUF4124 domain-containing protein n=1 Tax=Cupriavidus metallidurans TaxID=119219 RepID=UPI00056BD0BF